MKNSKLRRALLLVACAVLLVSLSVGATLAYLVDETEDVVNTFTVGKVAIKLDEAVVDEAGKPTTGRTEEGNRYKLMPGHTYTKDPTVTLLADSEESYVRMIVTINDLTDLKAAFPAEEYWYGEVPKLEKFVDWHKTEWPCVSATLENGVAKYVFNYHTTVSTADKTTTLTLTSLFDNFTIPGTVENEELLALEDMTITVIAHAIQADGFADADAAWAAFPVTE